MIDFFSLLDSVGKATEGEKDVRFVVHANVFDREKDAREDKVFEFSHFRCFSHGCGFIPGRNNHRDVIARFDGGGDKYYHEHVEIEWHLEQKNKAKSNFPGVRCTYPSEGSPNPKGVAQALQKIAKQWSCTDNPDPFSRNSTGYKTTCWMKDWPDDWIRDDKVPKDAKKVVIKRIRFLERGKKRSGDKKEKQETKKK